MLEEVVATRYVTPLREGGSLPGIVEADDLGTYVMKFTGAGQGRKTLVAEVICGQLGRRLGLRVPELVTIRLDPVIGLGEPDQEVQELLKASGGLNLGMDYLPGSIGFDPLAYVMDPVGSRSCRLVRRPHQQRRPVLAQPEHAGLARRALAHRPRCHDDLAPQLARRAGVRRQAVRRVRPRARGFGPDIAAAAAELAPRVTGELLAEVAADVPDEWLAGEPGFASADAVRRAYAEVLLPRAATIHERVTIGERTGRRPSRAPGWLTDHLAPWPHPTHGTKDSGK